MTTKHTPGPWKAVRADDGYWEIEVKIKREDGSGYVDTIAQAVLEEADARLIAAAPNTRQALVEEVALLRAWARESREGGWSTHQVDPMLRRADDIDKLLAKALFREGA